MSTLKPNRQTSLLTPEMEKRTKAFILACNEKGLPVFVTEGFRTKARQTYLYAFGRYGENKDKGQVTWTMNSNHLKGEAIDIAFNKPADLYPQDENVWEDVYDTAEDCGLISLFRESGYDKPHFNFNHNWEPAKEHWGLKFEKKLLDAGVIRFKKDLDLPPSRAELYKIIVNAIKKSKKI